MKKITDLLKPNLLIIFGALLFLVYLNWLSATDEALALGIIAVVFSAYYLTIGILGIIIGNKFSPMLRKIFDVISACLFPLFMFTYFLIMVIDINQVMGPTAWIISILSMVASLAVVTFVIISKFVNKPIMLRFAYLSAAIFALALLLNILFDAIGNTTALGDISIVLVALYALFVICLFNIISKVDEPKKEEALANNEEAKEDSTEAPQE